MSLVPPACRDSDARASAAGALRVFGLLHGGIFAREYHKLSGDVSIYQSYGVALRDGEAPYRDIAIDYPPGALPAFLPAAWPRGGIAPFELAMLACGVALVVLLALAGAGSPALLLAGLSPLLIGDLLRTRFDLWPAALVTGGVVALLADRHRIGWALLERRGAKAMRSACCRWPPWRPPPAGVGELIRAAGGAVAGRPCRPCSPARCGERPGQLAAAQVELGGGPDRRGSSDRGRHARQHRRLGARSRPRSAVRPHVLVWCWSRSRGEPVGVSPLRGGGLCAFVAFGRCFAPS
jgi:hypothetical protein